jgi:hypothetical protein
MQHRRSASALAGGFLLFLGLGTTTPAAPEDLPSDEFLRQAQSPMSERVWTLGTGDIQHRSDEHGRIKLPIRLALQFGPSTIRGEVVVNGQDVYSIWQQYMDVGVPRVELTLPENRGDVTLKTLGIRSEDLTFSFLYWDLESELAADEVRRRECRVFDLVHPETGERARAWISTEYLFPLRVWWYAPEGGLPLRRLEFTSFKKHDDLWFVKETLLEGSDWQTKLTLVEVEAGVEHEAPAPEDLFRVEHELAPAPPPPAQ